MNKLTEYVVGNLYTTVFSMGVTLFQLESDFIFMVSTIGVTAHVSVNRDYGSLIMNKLSITNHNIQPETVSDYQLQTKTDRECIAAMHNIMLQLLLSHKCWGSNGKFLL